MSNSIPIESFQKAEKFEQNFHFLTSTISLEFTIDVLNEKFLFVYLKKFYASLRSQVTTFQT